MLKKLTEWVIKYPIVVIAITIFLTVFFYIGFSKVTMANEIRDMLPENDPRVLAFDEIDQTFGGASFIMIILDMGEVFNNRSLNEIERLTLELEEVNQVNSVTSITNVEEIRGVEEGIEVAEIIEDIPTNEAELRQLKDRVLSDDDYAGQIVSKNGAIALIIVQMTSNADKDAVINNVKETIGRLGLDEKVHITGEDIMNREVNRMSSDDMSKLLPLALLVIIAVLFLSFRNIRAVVLPLIIVIVTIIWVVGLMGYTGIPFSSVSVIMPIILISMSIAAGIHILSRYQEEIALGLEKKELFIKTMVAVGLACFLTTITTMVGFATLYTSSIRPIKNFGLFTAIGVGIAFIITISLFLALLSLLPLNRKSFEKKRKTALTGVLEKWADFVVNRARLIIISASLLTLFTGVGIMFIGGGESDIDSFFKPDHPIVAAENIIKENFDGSEIIQIAVKGNILDPEVLKAMEQLENEISNIEILGKPSSIVNILRNTTKALHEGKEEFEILPETQEEVAQYFLLLEMGGADSLDNFITFDYDQASIQVRVEGASTLEVEKMVEEVEKAIEKYFNSDTQVVLTGMPVLTGAMDTLLVKGQLQSLALAILLIFVLMILLTRSLIYGIFCVLPVSLTVILNFGIMGWFKIPLDIATAMVSSIAIGIGIDYAIHFFNRYKEELVLGRTSIEALRITIVNTGRAISYNALAVGLGFLMLLFASMPPLIRFGYLIALTMFFSSMASMTVLPALLYLRDRNRILINTQNKESRK
ncbi:MAG: MMPL family transporter [Spirochaetia bacterium]|jgi:predicted RND superfamily exporter protein|nr:MMPL family transporter [Spirochaetia bacterium]